jgi:hypothetical protein
MQCPHQVSPHFVKQAEHNLVVTVNNRGIVCAVTVKTNRVAQSVPIATALADQVAPV